MTINNPDSTVIETNQTRPQRDWKSNIGLLAAVISAFSGYALWQYDLLASTSISTKVIYSTPLVFDDVPGIKNLEVMLDGKKIDKPYVSAIRITNDGSKPIPTANFEAPLEFVVGDGAKVVQAKISGSEPTDLNASIVITEKGLRLQPLLLNQGDTLKVVVVTSHAPNFRVKGRINSVRKLDLIDETSAKSSVSVVIMYALVFAIGCVLYPFAALSAFVRSMPNLPVPRLTMGCFAILTGFATIRSSIRLEEIFDLNPWPLFVVKVMSIVLCGLWVYRKYSPLVARQRGGNSEIVPETSAHSQD